MEKHMNQLENIEQEMVELRSQLKESFGVLENLGKIQTKFGELAETQKQFEEYTQQAKTTLEGINQNEHTFHERFNEIETAIDSKWEEFHGEVLNVQEQGRNTLEDIAQAKEKFNQQLGELNNLKNDLRVTLNQLKESGLNPLNLQKLDKLDNQIRGAISYLHNMDKQMQMMRNWLVVSLLTAAIALSIPLSKLIFKPASETPVQNTSQSVN